MARILGASGYGIYSFAISWTLLLQTFTTLGLGQVISRNMTTYQEAGESAKIHGLMKFSFVVVGVVSTVSLLIAWAVLEFVYKGAGQMNMALAITFMVLPINALLVPCESVLSASHRVLSAQIPNFVLRPVIFILLLSLAWFFSSQTVSINMVLLSYVLASGISLCVAIFMYRGAIEDRVWSCKPVYEIREWMRSATPLVFLGGMLLLNNNIDILMITSMKGPQDAGVYNAAIKGAELIFLVLVMINAPLAPIIARLFAQKDIERLQRLLTRAVRISFFLAICVALPLIFFGDRLLSMLGPEFARGHVALFILSCGQLCNIASGSVGLVLIMGGREAYATRGMAFSVITHVLLNILLIPRFGIEGAAFAMASSIIILNVSQLFSVRKLFKLDPTFLGLYKGR